MAAFDLIEPFDVDDGSLADFGPALCFALGVEWQLFRERLLAGGRFVNLAMSEGVARLSQMAERQGRFVEHHPVCDGWAMIVVGDYLV